MKLAKTGLVQGQLFGSTIPSERIKINESTGVVSRLVTLRDPDLDPVETILGTCSSMEAFDDIRAVADLCYLQAKERPHNGSGSDMRTVDLFSGCGAMSLGVSEACRAVGRNFVAAGAFDSNERILEVYKRNFNVKHTSSRDLTDVLKDDLGSRPSPLEKELLDNLGIVDFVVAGPPCQGHSNLNNYTRRDDPKNALYFLTARFAELFRPRWIIVENVIAVLHDKGNVVHRTQNALENLGYETADGVVDLWSIGVAQTRRRHILAARRKDDDASIRRVFPYLEELIAPHATRPRPVRWAIEDLLNMPPNQIIDQPRRADEVTQARIDYLFDHGLFDLPKSQRPPSHKGHHGDSYKSVYGRMRWDEPAPTMTSGFATMGQGRFVHPKRRRTITPHEAARIQFIPDFFDFTPLGDNRGALAEAIGNAVPPKLSYVLALEMLR